MEKFYSRIDFFIVNKIRKQWESLQTPKGTYPTYGKNDSIRFLKNNIKEKTITFVYLFMTKDL